MKTIKVSEATNNQLDWLVAMCEEVAVYLDYHKQVRHAPGQFSEEEVFSPTSNPSQMWPIIDASPEMQFWPWGGSPDERNGELQCACLPCKVEGGTRMKTWFGKTKLIAAARCYIVSKLGETVLVPEELG